MGSKKLADFSPSRIIVVTMFFTILVGTLLLALPIAQTKPIPLIDLFFTSTSATCITGLFTIPLSDFTWFGHVVILGLIQVGALGLATMSLFIISLFVNMGLATKLMAGQILELDAWQNVKRMLLFIFFTTIATEVLGALCLFTVFKETFPVDAAWFYAVFHSVSSFCNAGISVFHDITEQHLEMYNSNILFLGTTTVLMFLGGLGYITLHEVTRYIRSFLGPKRYRFSLHSKIILYGASSLLITTAILFWILEHDNTLAPLGFITTIFNTLFHVVSFKSCGFLTANLAQFQLATIFLIMMIGFVGSSPGSTGSGVKITTFFVFLRTIKAAITGRAAIEISGRRIPLEQVYKAIAIISLSFGWILLTTFCLLITESGWSFLDLLFETVTAFTNVGFSMGGTDKLTMIGKLFIIATMFVGRIGSLTLVLGLKIKTKKETAEFSYPEERVMLG